jgi:hypothetical protein
MISLILVLVMINYVILLAYIFKSRRVKASENPKEEKNVYYLPQLAGVPEFKDIDPRYDLLKSVLESAKLESWELVEFKLEESDKCYDIKLKNPNGAITIGSRIRLRSGEAYLSWFNIVHADSAGGRRQVSWDNTDVVVRFAVIDFMWSYISEYHDTRYNEKITQFKLTKRLIEAQLKTLGRDKLIMEILK